ncbi:unnamed protein product [Amoebophrya sp. A120]|nr:unnamed protein product [Amoebophrya sp. A120]|eukprot:GSA120T00018573001.1
MMAKSPSPTQTVSAVDQQLCVTSGAGRLPTPKIWSRWTVENDDPSSGPSAATTFTLRNAVVPDLEEVHKMIYELAVYEKEEDQMKLPLEQFIRDSGLPGSGNVDREDGSGPQRYQCLVLSAQQADVEPSSRAINTEQQSEAVTKEKIVGYALYFFTYSTWEGRAFYLEDLYVRPEVRKGGLGTKMVYCLAKIAAVENCCRLQWQCIDWNTSSLEFYYKKLKAEERTETNDAKWVNIWLKRARILEMAAEFDGE